MQQEKKNPFGNHTRLSMIIHLFGMMLIGMALGLNAYKYVESYIGFPIFGLPLLGFICTLVSVYLRKEE